MEGFNFLRVGFLIIREYFNFEDTQNVTGPFLVEMFADEYTKFEFK